MRRVFTPFPAAVAPGQPGRPMRSGSSLTALASQALAAVSPPRPGPPKRSSRCHAATRRNPRRRRGRHRSRKPAPGSNAGICRYANFLASAADVGTMSARKQRFQGGDLGEKEDEKMPGD
eukprot:scaffold118896_cov39-Phaeocystis_antarctica.AAC.1